MDFSGRHVLVTDGDSRQILPIIKGLHEIGCEITTVCKSHLDNGCTSRYVDQCLFVDEQEPEVFYSVLLKHIQSRKYDVLIALSDFNMDLITRHIEEIEEYVHFPFADRSVFLKAYNKQITMEICMENSIDCPKTRRDNEELEGFIQRVGFPIVAKPRMACGSMGLKIIKDKRQLDGLIDSGEVEIAKYVFQEYIPQTGKQINVHVFMDDKGEIKAGVVTEKTRWYPVDGGASCLCRTIHNDNVLDECVRLLQVIDWKSYCEIELIEDPRDGGFKIMEINGRASASIKIMDLVGINVAEQMMQLAFNEEVRQYNSYPDDIRMRRLSADTLWLLQATDRFKRKPSWFDFRKTHEVTFDRRDPVPFLTTGLRMMIQVGKYKKEMKKRKRT